MSEKEDFNHENRIYILEGEINELKVTVGTLNIGKLLEESNEKKVNELERGFKWVDARMDGLQSWLVDRKKFKPYILNKIKGIENNITALYQKKAEMKRKQQDDYARCWNEIKELEQNIDGIRKHTTSLEQKVEAYRIYQNNCSYTDNIKVVIEELIPISCGLKPINRTNSELIERLYKQLGTPEEKTLENIDIVNDTPDVINKVIHQEIAKDGLPKDYITNPYYNDDNENQEPLKPEEKEHSFLKCPECEMITKDMHGHYAWCSKNEKDGEQVIYEERRPLADIIKQVKEEKESYKYKCDKCGNEFTSNHKHGSLSGHLCDSCWNKTFPDPNWNGEQIDEERDKMIRGTDHVLEMDLAKEKESPIDFPIPEKPFFGISKPKFMGHNCIRKMKCPDVSEVCHHNCDKYHQFDLREFIDVIDKAAQVKEKESPTFDYAKMVEDIRRPCPWCHQQLSLEDKLIKEFIIKLESLKEHFSDLSQISKIMKEYIVECIDSEIKDLQKRLKK